MQQKAINFNNWLSELVQMYVPPCPEKEEIQKTLERYFDSEENFDKFMFTALPTLCSIEKTKQQITNLRTLKDKATRKEALVNVRSKLVLIKSLIDSFLLIDEDELDATVMKFSLYVNLFTDMYFAAPTPPPSPVTETLQLIQ